MPVLETVTVVGAATYLLKQIIPDLKDWTVSRCGSLKRKHVSRERAFDSLPELFGALEAGQLQDETLITLRCKAHPFGPFFRRHFLTPVVGNQSDFRVGPVPKIVGPPGLEAVAQLSTHLMPVGLYPSLGSGVAQACLYPHDAPVCGGIGLIPELVPEVSTFPALLSTRHTHHYGKDVKLRGLIRAVDPLSLFETGFTPELAEELRQKGKIWFLDTTDDDLSDAKPIKKDEPAGEMWGGLYAQGHLEFGGELDRGPFAEGMRDAMRAAGFEPHVTQNKAEAGRQEMYFYAKGCRAVLDGSSPVFSVHMDAELVTGSGEYRRRFDSLTETALRRFKEACEVQDVKLRNPLDLDFSYTNSSNTFTVLRSAGADAIDMPAAVAIRDWHRRRGA